MLGLGGAKGIPSFFFKVLLVLATVIWGLGFVVMKDAVAVMPPAYLIGTRFLLTAIVLTIFLFPHLKGAFRKDWLIAGLILGILNFLGFWVQTIGVAFTTPGKNAFLTGTYCVMVPFVYWAVARRKPSVFNVVAAVLCVAGVGFVSLSDLSFSVNFGDAMTLLCAVFFAIHIVFVSKLGEGRDILALTIFQFWVGGVMGLAIGFFAETPPSLAIATPEFLFEMFYLVILCSCIALVFQNVALMHVNPAPASVLLSLESVFGVAFSALLYGEALTARLVFGFALIFVAILVSEVAPLLWGRGKQAHGEISLAGDQVNAELYVYGEDDSAIGAEERKREND